jgi:hypothetical protein
MNSLKSVPILFHGKWTKDKAQIALAVDFHPHMWLSGNNFTHGRVP